MPFSKTSEEHTEDYWTKQFQGFLKPLIETNGNLMAERSSPLRGDILRQIITDLVTASIVVADLTDSNPNVFWELGVRQSFKHCTVTIAEIGTTLPFDLGIKGTLFYHPKNHIKMREFDKLLSAALDDCVANPKAPDSHVLETISGRGTLYQIITRDESIRKLDALNSELRANSRAFDRIHEQCEKNKQDPKQGKTLANRFRISAIQTLATNRYLDVASEFYESAEILLNRLIMWNDQLSLWEHSPVQTEAWFLKNQKYLRASFDNFSPRLNQEKERIEKTL